MPPIPPLFVIPIGSNGSVICTQPSAKVYLLTFASPPDNRLTPDFCKALLLALDVIEYKLPNGVVVTTSAIEKFYSNGLDYNSAIKDATFFKGCLYPLWRRILTFPMPTIALINGHAFAGALMTAMMHDYRLMNPHKGYLCLNELEFGATLAPTMASIFREKLPRPDTYRTMVLESKRFNALEALKEGIVDGLGSWDATMAFVSEMELVKKGGSGVYGKIKAEMWRQTVALLDNGIGDQEDQEKQARDQADAVRADKSRSDADAFEAMSRTGRAKL